MYLFVWLAEPSLPVLFSLVPFLLFAVWFKMTDNMFVSHKCGIEPG